MRGAQQELVLIREALEGFIAPEVATALLFDALAHSEAPPRDLLEARDFVSGPLTHVVRHRVRPDDVTSILDMMHDVIDAAIARGGVEVHIELDDMTASSEGSTETQQLSTVVRPVPVLVVATTQTFGERLVLCLGEERVFTWTVAGAEVLRKALFTRTPMLVVFDATASEGLSPQDMAEVVRGFPDDVVPVLWGGDTAWGKRLAELARGVVTIERAEGIEPLCDLVLSRFRGGRLSVPPHIRGR